MIWPWKNARDGAGQEWVVKPGGKIEIPKNFHHAFDWSNFYMQNVVELPQPRFIGSRNFKSIFTTAARMVGYETLLCEKPSLYSIYMAYQLWNELCIERLQAIIPGPITLFFGDDIAYTNGLMMKPEETIDYALKYTLQMAFDLKKRYNSKDHPIKLMFHSCGDISEILRYLIDFDYISYQPVGRMKVFEENNINKIGNIRLIVHDPHEAGIIRPKENFK